MLDIKVTKVTQIKIAERIFTRKKILAILRN